MQCHFASARWIAAAFALYGLLATAILAVNFPPFQNPDEEAHFMRAAQIAGGGIVGMRFSDTAGGLVDPALWKAFEPFGDLPFRPEKKVTQAAWATPIYWSHTRALSPFPNTAVYPPFFYVPATIGVWAGQAVRITVVQTLTISRLLTGIAAVLIGAIAIAYAGGASVWMFAILMLPMPMSSLASSAQDALLIAYSALAATLLVRALRSSADRNWKVLAGLAVTLGLVAMARPPYMAFAALPLGLTNFSFRWRMLAAGTVAALVIVWSAIAAKTSLTNIIPEADAGAQIARLLDDPTLAFRVGWETLTKYWPGYLESFVGRLGWNDVELPAAYHVAAWVMLICAALASALGLKGDPISVKSYFVIALGLLLSVIGIFAIAYIAGTAPGKLLVDGVWGRYFVPVALIGAALLPALGGGRLVNLHTVLAVAVALFPVVTLSVVVQAVVVRYYLN